MAKNGFKVIDSDMHIMEPPELWEKYIDKKFRDRAPRGMTSHNVRDLRLVRRIRQPLCWVSGVLDATVSLSTSRILD